MGKAKFSMIFKIDLNIVHGFMNATFIYDGYEQWSSTINVHSYIYEHTSCMINDHRNSYDHWSSMIIDHNWHSNRSMIVAMECCWSYMISVDQWVISWSLLGRGHNQPLTLINKTDWQIHLMPQSSDRFILNYTSHSKVASHDVQCPPSPPFSYLSL